MSRLTANSPSKKSNQMEQFSQEYQRFETKIRDYQEKKEQITKLINDKALQFDIAKRQHATRVAIFNERIKSAQQRKKDINNQADFTTSAEVSNKEAEKANKTISEEVEILKKKLEKIYQKIAEAVSQSYEIGPNTEARNTKSQNEMLKMKIKRQNQRLLFIEDNYSSSYQKLKIINEKEQILSKKKAELLEKESQVDSRRLHNLQIMAEPIDSLTYEEDITKEIEKDAESAEKRFSGKTKGFSDDLTNEYGEVSQLETENSKRKTILEKKKTSVAEMKNYFKKSLQNSPKTNPKKGKSDNSQNKLNDSKNANMQSVVEQISQRLQKKQEEIDGEERAIDQLSANNAIWRKQKSQEWEEQMKKVKTLNSQMRRKESFSLKIAEISEQNDEDKQNLYSLESKVAQLRRRGENAKRDKDNNSYVNKQLEELKRKYEEHKKKVEEGVKRNIQFKEELESLTKSVNDSEAKYHEYEVNVVKLEENIKKVEVKLSDAVEKLHSETDKLDELLKKVPKEQSEQLDGFKDLFIATTEIP